MRRALPLLLVALVAVAPACGGDEQPDNRPGAAGAFGGADDCDALVGETIEAQTEVLTALGDARRTDTERIDEALTTFGEGPDLAVRYEGLGCDQEFADAVCAASADLVAEGPAGRDLVATWTESCA